MNERLQISQRDAMLSTNASFRTQFHGDDQVTGGDIGISEVMTITSTPGREARLRAA